MQGVKVNGKIATLDYILQNGDIVEVMTSSAVKGPSRDWLKLCKTSQARSKINQWLKKERREENIQHGKDLIDKELKRVNLTHSQLFRPEWVEMLCRKYTFASLDDIYAAVGYGGLTVNKVIGRLREEYKKALKLENPDIDLTTLEAPQKRKKTSSNGVIVEGLDDCLVRFSRCCSPVPGDDIVGYITRGRGVSVHRRDCSNIIASENSEDKNRLIRVHWETETSVKASYFTELQVYANDRKGLLAEMAGAIADLKILITGINSKPAKDGIVVINLSIEISSKDQLDFVAKKLGNVKGVFDVKRRAE